MLILPASFRHSWCCFMEKMVSVGYKSISISLPLRMFQSAFFMTLKFNYGFPLLQMCENPWQTGKHQGYAAGFVPRCSEEAQCCDYRRDESIWKSRSPEYPSRSNHHLHILQKEQILYGRFVLSTWMAWSIFPGQLLLPIQPLWSDVSYVLEFGPIIYIILLVWMYFIRSNQESCLEWLPHEKNFTAMIAFQQLHWVFVF